MTHKQKTKFFEDNYEIFVKEIEKRRRKWTLKANLSLDFDDAKQICLRHLFVKLELYDAKKSPISHWCNAVISSQLSNIIRNNYTNVVRPCQKCSCAQPDEGCDLYDTQNSTCPLFKKWHESKRNAYNIRLALPSENHLQEVFSLPNINSDVRPQILEFNIKIKKYLKPFEQRIYYWLFEVGLSEEETAKKLNYKSVERFKYPGYASIAKAKKVILEKARQMIKDGEIDII